MGSAIFLASVTIHVVKRIFAKKFGGFGSAASLSASRGYGGLQGTSWIGASMHPNHARYQLRYTRIAYKILYSFLEAKSSDLSAFAQKASRVMSHFAGT